MDCDLIDEEFVYGRNIEKIKRKKELILDSLRNVVDPDLKKDIVELNFIRNLQIVEKENKKYDVEFDLNLTTPACPVKEELVEECKKNLNTFDWVESLKIHQTFENFESGRNREDDKETSPNKIENVILIYSCKGGVGKSFFSVNFSFYLKKKGASVGILDADINGPSLSTLLPFDFKYAKFEEVKENERGQRRQKQKTEKIFYENDGVLNTEEEQESVINNIENSSKDSIFNLKKENGDVFANEIKREVLIEPLNFKGVKLMSYSYIKNKGDLGFAPFRGAIINELIHEFINHVNWGVLNYLIIDMPPGTSDMHLNLMDGKTHIDGTIIITTPNELAINDVQKSINMCNYFNIPIISLIVNMSYFICDNCNKKHYIFNSASVKQMKNIERSDSTSVKSTSKKTKDKSKYSSSCSSSSSSSNSSNDKEREMSEENEKDKERGRKEENEKNRKEGVKKEEETEKAEEENEEEEEEEEEEEGSGDNLENLKRQVSKVHEIPFHPLFAKNVYYRNGEKKFPFLLAYDDHFLIKHLENIFENIVREISILKNNDKCVVPSLQVYKKHFLQLSFDTVKNRFVFSEDVLISHIRNIRMKCKCEICKLKNKKLHKKSSMWNPNIFVKEIKQLGVYNVKIIWSDNHISVYSYSYLKHLFMKINQTTAKKIPCYDTTQEQFDW